MKTGRAGERNPAAMCAAESRCAARARVLAERGDADLVQVVSPASPSICAELAAREEATAVAPSAHADGIVGQEKISSQDDDKRCQSESLWDVHDRVAR